MILDKEYGNFKIKSVNNSFNEINDYMYTSHFPLLFKNILVTTKICLTYYTINHAYNIVFMPSLFAFIFYWVILNS